jgi:hypothetical protein
MVHYHAGFFRGDLDTFGRDDMRSLRKRAWLGGAVAVVIAALGLAISVWAQTKPPTSGETGTENNSSGLFSSRLGL